MTQGTFYPYNADALSDFSDMEIFTGSALYPSLLGTANSDESTVFGAVAHVFADGGKPIRLDYANGIDAVSAVLMADHLYNEYLVSDNLGSNTDWVVTFPTKRFYVDTYYTLGAGARAPFVEEFMVESAVRFRGVIYDREEGETTWTPDSDVPPLHGAPGVLPFEVNVISWLTETAVDDPSGVFGSKPHANIAPYADAGWASIDLAWGDGGHALPRTPRARSFTACRSAVSLAYNIVNEAGAAGPAGELQRRVRAPHLGVVHDRRSAGDLPVNRRTRPAEARASAGTGRFRSVRRCATRVRARAPRRCPPARRRA